MTDKQEVIEEEICCPACGKNMRKIFIPEANMYIDICIDGCGGIYFDKRELTALNNNSEQISKVIAAFDGKTFNKVDESKDRSCPVCGFKMVKHEVNKAELTDDKPLVIDECYNCGGKFLDHGELEQFKHRQAQKTEEKAHSDVMDLYSAIGINEDSLEKDLAKTSPIRKLFNNLFGY